MSLLLFEGAAGTGKTTRLRAAARDHLKAHPLGSEERVLALTKYHGSRRRMDINLRQSADGIGNALDCVTIDSFAWNVVNRWRALLGHLGLHPAQGDFASVVSAAGRLLQRSHVAKWIARRYPLVIVDEMQDCNDDEVAILRGLEPHLRLLCGADAFQDLSGRQDNVAIRWASEIGEPVQLTKIHRTHNDGLLAAALALRCGSAIASSKSAGFEIVPAAVAAQGGAVACWRIRSWAEHGPIALICGTARGTSTFADDVVNWVCTRTSTAKNGATAGPYPVEWESDDAEAQRSALAMLHLPAGAADPVGCADLVALAYSNGLLQLRDWANHQLFVRGLVTVTVADIVGEVGQIVRRERAFGPNRPWQRRVMTIHQAKNREFESVIVLWPLKLGGQPEQKRRLLYNAVTRARGRAVVIVQDPKGKVVTSPLFMGTA